MNKAIMKNIGRMNMTSNWDGYTSFTIYGQPVSKKNAMQMARTKTGRFFPVPSAAYRKWLTLAKQQISGHIFLRIDEPIHLKIIAYRHTKRNIDLSNIYAAVEDMLQKLGVIKDDGQVQSHDGSRKILGVAEGDAKVVITITRFEGEGC